MGLAAAALGVLSVGASVQQGEEARSGQRRALRQQEQAQRQATSAAVSQRRRSEQESRRANRRQPDVSSIFDTERAASARGPASTLLTGPTGVDPNRLLLGRTSLLGG